MMIMVMASGGIGCGIMSCRGGTSGGMMMSMTTGGTSGGGTTVSVGCRANSANGSRDTIAGDGGRSSNAISTHRYIIDETAGEAAA